MSSGYKIKGHQRSRSAKPYERKTGLVNRVKEWLTPSSWLSNWNRSTNDIAAPVQLEQRLAPQDSGDVPSASHSVSPLFVPRPGALRNPFLSNPMALLGVPGSQLGPSDMNRTLDEAPPTSVGVAGSRNGSPHSTSDAFHSDTGMETRLRSLVSVPLSLRSSGIPSGPLSMTSAREDMNMADASSSKDSEGSWVAEDDGSMEQEEAEDDGRGQSPVQLRTKSFPTTLNLSDIERTDEYMYDLGEGSAGVVQPATCVTPVATEAEQVILQVENPAAKSPPHPSSSFYTTQTTSTDNSRTEMSSSLLNRPYTTNPFAMSTPELSPVHETREETVHQDSRDGPKHPVSHSGSGGSSSSQFHSQASILSAAITDSSLPLPAMSTPSKFHTEESLKRSPFRSPFYSGRTSFGGAASGQKPRVKRPRTESSPPVITPLRLSVKARPVSSGSKGHQLVASQTARKIMKSLGSLSSPLANARKLPMRATPLPGEAQLAKRRRVSLDASILSPPPITPLRTPSQPSHLNTETQIVPSEKSRLSRQYQTPHSLTSRDTENSGGSVDSDVLPVPKMAASPSSTSTALSSSLTSFPTLSSGGGGSVKLTFTVPDFSSTQPPKQSAILSGLKFMAPPFSVKPADRAEEKEDRRRSPPSGSHGFSLAGYDGGAAFPPPFLSQAAKNLGRGGGKMRTARRGRRGAPMEEEEEEEEDVGYINPMVQPPAVGLTLGKGGSLPKFLFHTQLATGSSSKSLDTAPTTQRSSGSLVAPAPSFAFSAPKSVVSESGPLPADELTLKQAATFDFSAPKDQRLTPTPPPPSSSLAQFTSKPLTLTTTSTSFKSSVPPKLNSLPKPSPFTPSSGLSVMNRLKEQPKGVQPTPPPLKAMSVEEALKQPEFQLPLSKAAVEAPVAKPAKPEATVCIDLTDSDDEKDSEPKPAAGAKLSLGSGGLQLGSSGGLKLGTPSGLQLGSSNASAGMSTISGAVSVLPVKLGTAASTSGPSGGISTNLKLKTGSLSPMPSLKPLSQFAPPTGSWECDQCMVRNQAKDEKCVACTAPKPSKTGTTKPTVPSFKPLAQFAPPADSWECGQCMIRNQAKDDKCVACMAPKPSVLKTKMDPKSSAPAFKPLAQFAPPSGSWECDQCMVNNQATNSVCAACTAPRPVKSSSTVSGLSKPSGSLSLGVPEMMKGQKQSAGSWSCEMCLVQNKAEDSKCVACTAAKPGSKTSSSEAPPMSAVAKWTCSTCLVVNKVENSQCIACSSPKMAANAVTPSLSNDPKVQKPPLKLSSIAPLTGFAPPTGSWTCGTCLVQNKAEDTKCVSCTTPKPGPKSTSESNSGSKTGTSSTAGGLTVGSSGGFKLGGGLTLSGGSLGQGGLKLLGSGGNGSQDAATSSGSGGIKITASLSSLVQGKSQKLAPESKQGSGLSLPTAPGSTQASSQPSIAQLPEKNPLAGIKFGVAATTSTATSQNPLAGIKFGIPATSTPALTTTTTASLQINFGTTSNSSSPFKLGSSVGGAVGGVTGEQTGGLKIGGAFSSSPSSSMDVQPLGGTQAAAPKLGGMFGGTQPTSAAATNPLAGIKFGVPTTQPSSSASTKLQFSSQPQLQFGTMAPSTASSSTPFSFSSSLTTSSSQSATAASASGLSGNVPSPFVFSGANNKPLLQFGASSQSTPQAAQQPPMLNSMLGSTTNAPPPPSTSSSLFMFSGNKDVSKIDSSSPFPSAGSASSSLGGFGATGGIGMGTGLGAGGAAQPLKLNFGTTQPSSNQPFLFGQSSSGGSSTSGAIFGKQEPAAQSQGLSLTGHQPAPGLTLPQTQGSVFGNQQQSQPQLGFGSAAQPPPFNFSGQASSSGGTGGSSSGGLGMGGAATSNLGFPSNTGGLNFGGLPASQGAAGLAGIGQTQATLSENNKQQQQLQGFQFNPNAGVNFNFGSGQTAPMGTGDNNNMLFSAGSSQSSAPSSRVIKKARRRKQ